MTTTLSESELVTAGERLGRQLPPGAVVWLEGELGAGKTTLVRAIVRGLGAPDLTSSPTYGLVNRYPTARGDIYHVDCYRLRHPDEASDLDWEMMTAASALLIEWPERAGPWAPPPSLTIQLEHTGDPDRRRMTTT